MNRTLAGASALVLTLAALLALGRSLGSRAPVSVEPHALDRLVQGTCQSCHNDVLRTANLSLDGFEVTDAVAMPETAEKMIHKLRAGMMPPRGVRRPGGDTLQALVEYLEWQLDRAAARDPEPGHRPFQRLNRAEYAAAVRDLLDLDVEVEAFLPPDTYSDNFDNIADVQTPSATLMEGYLRAADHVSRLAVGDPDAGARQTTYKVPKAASQLDHVEGAPRGTRGGISVVHTFPADGTYVFTLEMHPGPTGFLYGMTTPEPETLEVSIDGERVALIEVDRWMSESDPRGMKLDTGPIQVRAGPHRVSAAFLRTFEGPVDDLITPVDYTLADAMIGAAYGVTTLPHLRDLSIGGPHTVTGVSRTPVRRRIFTCRPTASDEQRPCAEAIVSRLAREAYRRPLTAEDVDDLMVFYEKGAAAGGFEAGVRTALQAILASPHFIFRLEETPEDVEPGEVYPVGDMALASRLSFFLWATPPDRELVELARKGRLSDPDVLEAQARRMLDDPRSEALATRFASQWLRLQDLDKIRPDAQLFPYYDERLADAMRRETQLLFDHLVREDRSLLELLTADYTFVNERLAEHYRIPGVNGREFRKVGLQDPYRRGLLGHGSILTLTSHADRTSPVLRGKWVLEVLLGTPPPPPPPNVPDLDGSDGVGSAETLTTRERMEQHRANPVCMSCHQVIDPIGLSLDNFDVTGAWRIKENGRPLDTSSELYDGTPLEGPGDLREAILGRRTVFIRTFTKNLMAYALGRRVEHYDMPTIRRIEREAAAEGNPMSAFVLGVVKSPAFRLSRAQPAVDDAPETVAEGPRATENSRLPARQR